MEKLIDKACDDMIVNMCENFMQTICQENKEQEAVQHFQTGLQMVCRARKVMKALAEGIK